MTKRSLKVEVEPEIFKWLLESSGYKIEDVSKRLGVSKKIVERWLSGEDAPTLNQIRQLSTYFGRSLAVFLLSKPPEKLSLPEDRRSIKEIKPLSPKTYKAIRTARWIQSIAANLMENVNLDTNPRIKRYSQSQNPEQVAITERENLGVKIDEQIEWEDKKAFEYWRELIEKKNILVLQLPLPIEEVRGFVLTDKKPFVIVVSSSDDPHAKIFTLFHEYAHLISKESSICNPLAEIEENGRNAHERWCNSFAGSFLLPANKIKEDFIRLERLDFPKRVTRISNRYKVSKHAVIVRLLVLDVIKRWKYDEEVRRLTSKKKKKSGGRSLPLPEKRINERGKKFVSLVLENARSHHITNSDVLDYLAIKTKHLKPIRSMVKET